MDLLFIYDITNTAYHPRHSKEAKLKGASLALVGPAPETKARKHKLSEKRGIPLKQDAEQLEKMQMQDMLKQNKNNPIFHPLNHT